jgi:hypothetical protein
MPSPRTLLVAVNGNWSTRKNIELVVLMEGENKIVLLAPRSAFVGAQCAGSDGVELRR